MRDRIDDVSKIDRSLVTYENLTPHYGTGQSIRLPDRHYEKRYAYQDQFNLAKEYIKERMEDKDGKNEPS